VKKIKNKKVYCSGALFCPGELFVMAKIADLLEKNGYDVFLPHRDGLEPFCMKHANNKLLNSVLTQPINRELSKCAFSLDMYEIIMSCDYFLVNLNGRVPDDGAVSEMGMAYAAGKPVLIYKDDIRTPIMEFDDPMVMGVGSFAEIVSSIDEIPDRLLQIEGRDFIPSPDDENRFPVPIQKMIKRGRMTERGVKFFSFLKPKE